MNFTSTPPTKPGFYAWKPNNANSAISKLLDVHAGDLPNDYFGLWCLLLPADEMEELQRELTLLKSNMKKEVEKGFREGWMASTNVDIHFKNADEYWLQSNARKVVEGV